MDPKEKQSKKFEKLPEEWRVDMMGRDGDDDINTEIRKAAMNLVVLEMAKAADEDLASLREQIKTAQEQYTEGKKQNLIKIEFLIEVLRGRGRDVPGIDDFLKKAVKEAAEDRVPREVVDAARPLVSMGKSLAKGSSITFSGGGRSVTIEGES